MITNKALLCEFTATLRQMAWNSTNTAWKTKRIKANSYKWLCIYDLKQHILWCGPLLTYILVHIPRDKLDWPLAYMLHLASCWLSFGCHMITLFGPFHHSRCFFTLPLSPWGLSFSPLGLLVSSLKMPREIRCLICLRGVWQGIIIKYESPNLFTVKKFMCDSCEGYTHKLQPLQNVELSQYVLFSCLLVLSQSRREHLICLDPQMKRACLQSVVTNMRWMLLSLYNELC